MDVSLCRFCYEIKGTTNIFDSINEINICNKLMYCSVNIRISENDGLPASVCSSCEEELNFAYHFILNCEDTDKKLRSLTPANGELYECNTKDEVKVEENTIQFEENFNFEPESYTPLESYQEDDIKSEPSITFPSIETIKSGKKKVKLKIIGKQKCKVCAKVCSNPSTLAIHMRKHSDDRPYACSSCEKKYKDGGSLKRHIERNHNSTERKRRFVCENCGKGFYSKTDVKIHMRTHTGETPYACDACPSKFTQVGALQRHQKRHTGERTHRCSKCNKMFPTKVDLMRHQFVHSNEKKYVCTICDSPFKYKNNLRKHFKMHSQLDIFICNYCGRSFNVKGNLKIHIDNIHSDKSGFCNICSKYVPNVEVHMWKHTGKRPLKCDLCSSSFFEKKALTRHINFKHKFTDKYKCTVEGCIVTFPSRGMLKYHVAKYHGSSIPYPCDGCSKGFYRQSDLARHRTQNHREKLLVKSA